MEKLEQVRNRSITFGQVDIVNYNTKCYGILVNFFTINIRIPTLILVINKLHIKYLKFGL